MIKSFHGKDAKAVFQGHCPTRLKAIRSQAERKLRMLDAATELQDLRSPPGNRLEALAGDRAGQYSIRINRQWRLCFDWRDGNAWNVEIVDYH